MRKFTLLSFILFFSFFTGHSQVNINLGLKAYYPFNGNANDASGNNNNPIFNNATLTSDRLGNPNAAYHFNGSNNYMRIPNAPTLNMSNTMSIALWVKATGYYTGLCYNNILLMKGDDATSTGNYYLRFADVVNGCTSSPSTAVEQFHGNNGLIAATPFVQLNKWYSVVLTCDGTTIKIYVDCVLRGSGAASSVNMTNTRDLFLGHMDNVTFPYWLNGDLDEVRIYDRALNTDEINFLGGCNTLTCNNWLATPSQPSYVDIGDLDISGNKITVEATANRTSFLSNGVITDGDLVSKHSGPPDVNYILRPTGALITTSNGFFATPPVCAIQLNKTYHFAMVYDGTVLKFYRNGFLMSQVAATGNLFQNNLHTLIGWIASKNLDENFIGYINEVRIWNIARTQAEIRSTMNTSIPSPTTQPGLQAYYTFDNLLNKQGNAAWNGTMGGAASINNTNPSCAFFEDSCATLATPISNIINHYTPVLGFDPCKNILTVGDATNYNIGDTVLLIQMKGAVMDSTNTAAFGTITDYKNAGNYEFNYVKSKSGNNIELKNVLIRNYDIPVGKVQLVRVPYYQSANVTSTLTCQPWNGSSGGIVVLNARDSVILNANIDVSGKGFLGGQAINTKLNAVNCATNNYAYPSGSLIAAPKGESIVNVSPVLSNGKGAPGSGGGGGLDHNSGGGGGANGGIGGSGGYQYDGCPNTPPFDNKGIGGHALSFSTAANKIFMGGGGGAGHCNQAAGMNLNGGNGGGIILIQTPKIIANGNTILSNGANAVECTNTNPNICNDGAGGGGAGGTILFNVNTYATNTAIFANGGKGASLYTTLVQGRVGPGGGGGGGAIWVNQTSNPANITSSSIAGVNGTIIQDANNPYGATAGQPGINVFNLAVPIATTLFKINIDSVRFNLTTASCNSVNFFGLAYINATPIATWQWYFGDGGTSNSQNTSHAYGSAGTYTVKLVATDNNGCKDSILRTVTIAGVTSFDFTYKQDVCNNPLSVQFFGAGASLVNPYWSFGDASTTTGTTTPTHVYSAPGNYLVRFTVNNPVCNDTISKMINISFAQADIILTPDTSICFGTTKQLRAQPSDNFCWSPTTFLTNPNSPTPTTSTTQTITYHYTSEVIGTNLVVNGDFGSGNTGFTSAYTYTAPTNTGNGQYFIGPFPSTWNPTFTNCAAYASFTMMMVNGATIPDAVVWNQSVNITPNTNYVFSTWVSSLTAASPAQLSFSINGIPIGNLIMASQPPCSWTQFNISWNSGNYTTASLSIVDKNIAAAGNDFIIDQISFAPVSIKRDSVKITVDKPVITVGGTNLFCQGLTGQIIASGSAGMNTYSWSPIAGLSNPNIYNPTVVFPPGTRLYTVTGTTVNGCSTQASFSVTVMPQPSVTITPDTTICSNASVRLLATGGNAYTWTPAATLSDPSIPDPVATPTQPTTKYYVTVHDYAVNGCGITDSVTVSLKPLPAFTISPASSTCEGIPFQLASGGGNTYAWSPAGLVSDPTISNPLATANTTTNYSVLITDNICNISKTLTTVVTVNPSPRVTASKSNDIDCSIGFSNLLASGAINYTWTSGTGLSSTIIANPVAMPTVTTQYIVSGTNAFGCVDTGTVTVAVSIAGKSGYLMPNTFTPNGDGKNDCFGVKYWGVVKELQFIIYNRYGEKVFQTTDPNKCWDGLYKNDKPLPGNYVYYIKAKTACGDVERKGNVLLIR
jgi:gliding motility-associated-like protein